MMTKKREEIIEDLGAWDIKILKCFRGHTWSMEEIARRTDISPSTVVKYLSRLAVSKLVKRTDMELPKRRGWCLTKFGERVAHAL